MITALTCKHCQGKMRRDVDIYGESLRCMTCGREELTPEQLARFDRTFDRTMDKPAKVEEVPAVNPDAVKQKRELTCRYKCGFTCTSGSAMSLHYREAHRHTDKKGFWGCEKCGATFRGWGPRDKHQKGCMRTPAILNPAPSAAPRSSPTAPAIESDGEILEYLRETREKLSKKSASLTKLIDAFDVVIRVYEEAGQ